MKGACSWWGVNISSVLRQVKKNIRSILVDLIENEDLHHIVLIEENQNDRLLAVDDYIQTNQDRFGISFWDWKNLYSEPVLLVMQKYLKIDFGFCEFYKPNFEDRLKSKMSSGQSYDVWPECTVSGKGNVTICTGQARPFCRFYVTRGLK